MTSNLSIKSAFFAMSCCLFSSTANADNSAITDPLYRFKAFEVNIGVGNVLNTLDGTFFATNNSSPGAFGGPLVPLLDTDILDIGTGGRVALKFSQPITDNKRFFVEAEISSTSEGSVFAPTVDGTYPGSYDDGFLVPAGFTVNQNIDTETLQLKFGQEWATSKNWRFRVAAQAGKVSQDFEGAVFIPVGTLGRNFSTNSDNTQLGLSVGSSYYSNLSEDVGLRLSADLGVFRNDFTYSYSNVLVSGVTQQSLSTSDIGFSAATKFSATLEKTLKNNSLVSLGIGLENFHNVSSGLQTFLNPQGTATTAAISKDTISTVFISLGYTHTF